MRAQVLADPTHFARQAADEVLLRFFEDAIHFATAKNTTDGGDAVPTREQGGAFRQGQHRDAARLVAITILLDRFVDRAAAESGRGERPRRGASEGRWGWERFPGVSRRARFLGPPDRGYFDVRHWRPRLPRHVFARMSHEHRVRRCFVLGSISPASGL